jgi:hypothetical protein
MDVFRADRMNSNLTEMSEHRAEDMVLNKSLVTFLLFTGVINCADTSAQFLIQNTYEKEKRTTDMISFVAWIWFYLLRVLAALNVLWCFFRFIQYNLPTKFSYGTGPQCGAPFFCFQDYFTAGCIAMQSVVSIYCCNHLRNCLFEENFKVVSQTALLQKHLPKAKLFLVFSTATATPYAIYILLNATWYAPPVRNAYWLLLAGQMGTSVMLSPILLFFLKNIETAVILVKSVNHDAENDTLNAAIYLEIEELLRIRQKKDRLMDQLFFAIILMSVMCIFISYTAMDNYKALDTTVFGMQYVKESVFAVIVVWGAAAANTCVDESIETMTNRLLRKCCTAQPDLQCPVPATTSSPVMNPVVMSVPNTTADCPASHRDSIPPSSSDGCMRTNTGNNDESAIVLTVESDDSSGANRDSILYPRGLTEKGKENRKYSKARKGFRESDVDSLAICMAAVLRPLSYPLCGVRITRQRARLVFLSAGISLLGLMFNTYYFKNI